ncbi:unnamed protein product [Amoebophrya sp. A25]|nr:unnamed protein product [Amoebophrya sp. A25]|eukprot:GSA25T00003198001.1
MPVFQHLVFSAAATLFRFGPGDHHLANAARVVTFGASSTSNIEADDSESGTPDATTSAEQLSRSTSTQSNAPASTKTRSEQGTRRGIPVLNNEPPAQESGRTFGGGQSQSLITACCGAARVPGQPIQPRPPRLEMRHLHFLIKEAPDRQAEFLHDALRRKINTLVSGSLDGYGTLVDMPRLYSGCFAGEMPTDDTWKDCLGWHFPDIQREMETYAKNVREKASLDGYPSSAETKNPASVRNESAVARMLLLTPRNEWISIERICGKVWDPPPSRDADRLETRGIVVPPVLVLDFELVRVPMTDECQTAVVVRENPNPVSSSSPGVGDQGSEEQHLQQNYDSPSNCGASANKGVVAGSTILSPQRLLGRKLDASVVSMEMLRQEVVPNAFFSGPLRDLARADRRLVGIRVWYSGNLLDGGHDGGEQARLWRESTTLLQLINHFDCERGFGFCLRSDDDLVDACAS